MNKNPPWGIGLLQGGIFMDRYPVLFSGKQVGNIQISREGLYCRIRCACDPGEKGIFRLLAQCGEQQLRLGVLLPEGKEQVLETKIPAKKLCGQAPEFFLQPVRRELQQRETTAGKYIPIYPDEPFSYLSRLKNAYLETRKGQIGIVIKD